MRSYVQPVREVLAIASLAFLMAAWWCLIRRSDTILATMAGESAIVLSILSETYAKDD